MRSYAAEVFWAVLPRKSFLKLKARSRALEFSYKHAPPAPYKGTHATVVTCAVGIYRVHTKATRKRVMSKRKDGDKNPVLSPNYRSASVSVRLTDGRGNRFGRIR